MSEGWREARTLIAKYRIDVIGDARPTNVWLRHDPRQRLELSAAERETVESRWAERLATGRRIFDLPLYRLLGWEVHGSRLVLKTGMTSYKRFLGLPLERGAAPLAVSAVAITSDAQVILHQRSAAVAELGGLWHVTPAGHPHPPHTIAGTVWTELDEELDVGRHELVADASRATGLVTNVSTGKPEVTLLLRMRLPASDVLSRKATDSWEYTRLEALEWSADNIAHWLGANVERCVPVGHAALLLAGRIDFGDGWFEERVAALQRHA